MTYTFKALNGGKYYDLPSYANLSFGFDYNDTGAIKFKYASAGINADKLNENALVIAYWDGVEPPNSRFLLQTGDGDDDPDEPYFAVTGRTLFDVFRRTVTRNPVKPGNSYRFVNATAGGIMNTMLTDAQARGASTNITWDFTSTKDSAGNPWAQTITIEYKPGLNYQDLMTNLVDQGMVDFRFEGNKFRMFNGETMGVDYSVANPVRGKQIELRAGLDYAELPNKWSVEGRANYSLLVGDEDSFTETTSNAYPVGMYGREEQAISQGGMSDLASMQFVNSTSLNRVAKTVKAYTRKLLIRDNAPIPSVDYTVGDYVLERLVGGLPTRYRVVSLVVGVDDVGAPVSAAITLNDRIMDMDTRLARKISGIVGGANAAGSGNGTTTGGTTDYTVPRPPTGVISTSSTYLDGQNNPRGMANTTWAAPITNTDGSSISDLSHYEVEHQIDGTISYDVPTSFGPAKVSNDLFARFDRRNKSTPGWFGADGGGNFTSDTQEVFHVWGDTLWGLLKADGTRVNQSMPRNTMTSFNPSSPTDFKSYSGVENMVPEFAASANNGYLWSGSGPGNFTVVPWSKAYTGTCLEITMTGAGTYSLAASLTRTTSQNNIYRPIKAGATYRCMVEFDASSTATQRFLRVDWVTDLNAVVSSVSFQANANGIVDALTVAPASATSATFVVECRNAQSGQKLRFTRPAVFQTSHQLQSWRIASKTHTVYNSFLNPDGALYRTNAVTMRNCWLNPSLYVNTNGFNSIGNAKLSRDLVNVRGLYDFAPQVDVVNPGALDRWQQDVADRASRQVNMITIGTSVTSGLTTTNFHNRYQTRLFDFLRKDYPTAGVTPNNNKNGYQGMLGYIPGFYTADPYCPSLPGPDGQGGGGQHQTSMGLGGQTIGMSAGQFYRFKVTCDSFRLFYTSDISYGANLTLIVDGTTYTFNGAVAGENNIPHVWDSPQLALKEHIIEIRNANPVGSWGNAYVNGFDFFAGDRNKGVHVLDGSQSGWSAQSFAASSATIAKSYALAKPSLVTIELGYNDAGSGRTSAQFKADVQNIIASIKNACTDAGVTIPSFLLIGGYDPGTVMYGNPNNPPGSWPEPWANYLTALNQIATSDPTGTAFVDLSTVMPRISDDTTGLYDGFVHPSDKGHTLVANILHGVVAPKFINNRKASLRVNVPANTANSGVTLPCPDPNFPQGMPFVYSVWIKGKAGAVLTASTAYKSENITLTGDWQRIVSNGTRSNGGSLPSLSIRSANNTQPAFQFWLSEIQFEKQLTASDYFDGESPMVDLSYTWAGTRYASESTASPMTPEGFTTSIGGALVTTVKSIKRYNPTAIKVSGYNPQNNLLFQATHGAGPITAAFWFYATEISAVYMGATFPTNGDVIISPLYTVPANTWTQIRLEGVAPEQSDQFIIQAEGSLAFYCSEVTVVNGEWHGGTFSGNSVNSEGITCTWEGAQNWSRSKAVYQNTNHNELGFNFFGEINKNDAPVQLANSVAAGGNVTEWLWAADGTYTMNNKAITIYPAVMSDASVPSGWNFAFNGTFYIAEFDLAAKRMTGIRRFARDPRGSVGSISWGVATATDGTYVYVYGSKAIVGDPNGSSNNYVIRATVANAFNGPYEVWSGGAWKAIANGVDIGSIDLGEWGAPGPLAPDVIAVTPGSGITSVRKFGTKWKMFALGGMFQTSLDIWTANAPQGTFTKESTVYTFPKTGYLRYSAKFQPGTDSNKLGYSMLFSQSSQDSIINPGYYIPTWLRGPSGATLAGSDGLRWIDNVSLNQSPDLYGNLVPGSVFTARVRAIDNNGNASTWAGGSSIVVAADTSGPNQPSTPLVTASFKGVRVVWDGLDVNGYGMPGDYAFFKVYISDNQSFEPTEQTWADTLMTRGGVSPIQGLQYGTTYWVRIVAYDTAGNASLPSEAAFATPQRLSDPDLPDKLITGAKIADEAISVTKLTVGAFGENLVPGGNMEEVVGTKLVAGWTGYFNDDPTFDPSNPIAGKGSLRFDMPVGGNGITIWSKPIPITPGEVYYLSGKFRTSRMLEKANIYLDLCVAATEGYAGAGFGHDVTLRAGASAGSLKYDTIEAGVEVPWQDDLLFGRVVIRFNPEATPYTVWADDIEIRKITGEAAIANASINNAKIKNLAVDDAKIADLRAGKITSDRIYADLIQAGRLMTAETGSRSLMDPRGFHVYDSDTSLSFDTSNGNTWMKGVLEASEIRGGVGYFPSQYDDAPGRVVINESGLVVDAVTTINLCENPSLESNGASYGVSQDTSITREGAVVKDYKGNIDLLAFTGTGSLKVWNKVRNGLVTISLGKVSANRTYTASWYSAGSTIDNSDPGWNATFGDYSLMGVIRDDNGARLANGRTGYLLRDGALQGVWKYAKSSGLDAIGYASGWVLRQYVTFTTPADLPANTAISLSLPAPRTQAGGNETQLAIVYDGIQLEEKAYMTRYCDGDQPSCSWMGTPHASKSQRNYIRSLWAPSQDEVSIQSSLQSPQATIRKMKLGSGTYHGTNAVELFMGRQWEMWNSGSGTWWPITWDGSTFGVNGRMSADDGTIYKLGDNTPIFNCPVNGWYNISCTITFPPNQQAGKIALRLRYQGNYNNPQDNAVVLASSAIQDGTVSRVVTLNWTGYGSTNYKWFVEGYQTTQSGSASMPQHSGDGPVRIAVTQIA